MYIAAIIFLLFAAVAWLAPTARALRNRKFQLALFAFATGPCAVGAYMLDRHPNVAMGAFTALILTGGVLWRLAGKQAPS